MHEQRRDVARNRSQKDDRPFSTTWTPCPSAHFDRGGGRQADVSGIVGSLRPVPVSLPIAVCVIMALGTLAALLPTLTPVGAQEIKQDYAISSSEPSRPENGWPAGRMIHCACYTRDDLIAVFRVQGDQAVSANLDQESDFDGTIWLIDVGNRGYYQVVVRFYRDQGSLRADYWQDHDGDGKVAIVPHDGTLQITEKGFPSIRAVARDGYWQRDGRLAPNLDLFVDDSMPTTFNADPYLDRMLNDGHADVVIRVRGNLPNDPRSYDWRNVYTPVPESSGDLPHDAHGPRTGARASLSPPSSRGTSRRLVRNGRRSGVCDTSPRFR